jgi:hypothetical protein
VLLRQSKHTVSENKYLTVLDALKTHHTPTIISCKNTPSTNVGVYAHQYLLVWEFTYPLRRSEALLFKWMSVGLISPAYTPLKYQLKSSVPLHELHRRVFEPQLSYKDLNNSVLLNFVAITQTYPAATRVSLKIFMKMSPVYNQFCPIFLVQYVSSACSLTD